MLKLLAARAAQEPFNLIVTGIFLLAIIHTFLAPTFLRISHHWRDEAAGASADPGVAGEKKSRAGKSSQKLQGGDHAFLR